MKKLWIHYGVGILCGALAVAGGLWLNELRNKAKTLPPAPATK